MKKRRVFVPRLKPINVTSLLPHCLFHIKEFIQLIPHILKVTITVTDPFWHSRLSSLFWRAAICLPTWPKKFLFHIVSAERHSSKHRERVDVDPLHSPFSQALTTTLAHDSSLIHISLKRKILGLRCFGLWFSTSFSNKMQWSKLELALWCNWKPRKRLVHPTETSV